MLRELDGLLVSLAKGVGEPDGAVAPNPLPAGQEPVAAHASSASAAPSVRIATTAVPAAPLHAPARRFPAPDQRFGQPFVERLTPQERVRLLRLIAASPDVDSAVYRAVPPGKDEFSSDDEPLAWDAEGWEDVG